MFDFVVLLRCVYKRKFCFLLLFINTNFYYQIDMKAKKGNPKKLHLIQSAVSRCGVRTACLLKGW